MLEHPFTSSTYNKIVGSILLLTAVFVQWGLLVLYAHAAYWPALLDSVLYIGLLAAAGFSGWYFLFRVRVWQAQVGAALLVQIVCLAITYSFLALTGLEDPTVFLNSLPLRFLFGLLCWIILIQWYRQLISLETEEVSEVTEKTDTQPQVQEEQIDRISVKNGSRIHIVQMEDLYCIQACGDYVTLVTPEGQFVKEQTMKYFETHLPFSTFVRIHRSSIVNTNYIMRVELFGKESYQVRLKNGISLKASVSGYKLLKERLNL